MVTPDAPGGVRQEEEYKRQAKTNRKGQDPAIRKQGKCNQVTGDTAEKG